MFSVLMFDCEKNEKKMKMFYNMKTTFKNTLFD